MTHYDPTTPNPDPNHPGSRHSDSYSGSPTIWQHVDKTEKAAKAASVLAAVALLIAVVSLVIGIIAVTDDDERGDFQPDSSSLIR